MPNPIEPQAPAAPQEPAYPLDYVSNPPAPTGIEIGSLALLVAFGLLIYWVSGEKASRKTSWE
jgi:hypothetical protein